MLTAALAVPALAQQPGRGMGRGFGGPLFLLQNKSVQEELKLTGDQIAKVTELQTKQKEAMAKLQDLSQEERKEKGAELRKQFGEMATALVKDTLKPEQAKRLKEITYQQAGLMNQEAQTELKLSDEQKEKVREIGKASFKEIGEVMQSGGGFGDPETQKKIAAIRKESNEKAVAVLNDEQKKQWTEMQGKPFEMKMEGFGGGEQKKKKKKDGV
jgi:hypothetical protein